MWGWWIQNPSRTFRKVSKAVRVGFEPNPMYEEAAAPETAITVARSTG
jgi:hypothetical protein